MAKPQKRRAASPRERKLPPPSRNGNQKPAGHTAGETPTGERYSVYRTLKIMQLLLQGCADFIFQHSQHFDDITAVEARKLHGEIARHQPTITAAIANFEKLHGNPNWLPRSEGGDA